MEGFLSVTNVTGVLVVGGKRFEDELYHVVELLFTGISGWAGLATILICVGGGGPGCHGGRDPDSQAVSALVRLRSS